MVACGRRWHILCRTAPRTGCSGADWSSGFGQREYPLLAITFSKVNSAPDSRARHDTPSDKRGDSGRTVQFRKALVAEDEFGVWQTLRQALMNRGAQVEIVRTGRELERALECDGPYRLVVTSARLPEKTGLGVLAKARGQRVLAPFIVVIGVHRDRIRVMISDPQSEALSSRMLTGPDLAALALNLVLRGSCPAA